MTPREAIIAEARTWLRTPWRHMADSKGVGVDCVMLLARVYEAAGVLPHIDPRPYPIDWHMSRGDELYLAGLERWCDPIAEADALPGDAVVYRVGRCFSHGAIVAGWPTIIHAYNGEGVVLADGRGGRLGKTERRFWRPRGL